MSVPAAGVAKNHGKTDACVATGWNAAQNSPAGTPPAQAPGTALRARKYPDPGIH